MTRYKMAGTETCPTKEPATALQAGTEAGVTKESRYQRTSTTVIPQVLTFRKQPVRGGLRVGRRLAVPYELDLSMAPAS